MNDTKYQETVDTMGQHLYERLAVLVDENRIGDSDAVYSEWIVDGRDPEDGSYEFTFIPSLID
jgi:hypothetical protein